MLKLRNMNEAHYSNLAITVCNSVHYQNYYLFKLLSNNSNIQQVNQLTLFLSCLNTVFLCGAQHWFRGLQIPDSATTLRAGRQEAKLSFKTHSFHDLSKVLSRIHDLRSYWKGGYIKSSECISCSLIQISIWKSPLSLPQSCKGFKSAFILGYIKASYIRSKQQSF